MRGELLSPFESWRRTSPTPVNALAAIFATILSYQLTALPFDLCFARSILRAKHRSKGRIGFQTVVFDIYFKLLTEKYSPLYTVVAAFLRNILDRPQNRNISIFLSSTKSHGGTVTLVLTANNRRLTNEVGFKLLKIQGPCFCFKVPSLSPTLTPALER